jgi:hypothetical protein
MNRPGEATMDRTFETTHRFRSFFAYVSVYAVVLSAMGLA